MTNRDNTPILSVKELKVGFPIYKGFIIRRQVGLVRAVDGISFDIYRGETLGLVGESGCGKTTTGLAVMNLVRPTEGSIKFNNIDYHLINKNELKVLRKQIQMIFQDPFSSLNPRMTVGNIIIDPIRVHRLIIKSRDQKKRVNELLELVGLNDSATNRYPHQFSGGQRQRVGIARALAVDPEFLVCDEPISALDVSIQAQILNLLKDLQKKLALTYLFISHDLAVVRHISDRIAVMYLGKIVEMAKSDDIYKSPLHPYTKALLSAVHIPDPKIEKKKKRQPLTGDIPNSSKPLNGCRFVTRCNVALQKCYEIPPDYKEYSDGHFASCHQLEN